MGRWGSVSATLCVATALLAGCSSDTDGSDDPIDIGFIEALSGDFAFVSVEMEGAARVAIDQINEAGGIQGRPLRLVSRDNQIDIDVARQAARELLEDDVRFIIAGTSARYITAIAEETVPRDAMTVVGISSSDGLNGPQHNGLMMRTSKLGQHYDSKWAEFVTRENNTIIVADTEQELADPESWIFNFVSLVEQLECKDGPCELITIPYPTDADTSYDWSLISERAKEEGATSIVFLNADSDLTIAALNAAENYKGTWHIQPHHAFAPLELFLSPEILRSLRWANMGVPESASRDELERRLTPINAEVNAGTAGIYDAVILLALAMSRADSLEPKDVARAAQDVANAPGDEVFASDVADVLNGDGDLNYIGASGPLDLDEFGDVIMPVVVLEGFDDDGNVTVIED